MRDHLAPIKTSFVPFLITLTSSVPLLVRPWRLAIALERPYPRNQGLPFKSPTVSSLGHTSRLTAIGARLTMRQIVQITLIKRVRRSNSYTADFVFGRVWTRTLDFMHIDRLTDSSTIIVHNRETVFKNTDVATRGGGLSHVFFLFFLNSHLCWVWSFLQAPDTLQNK